MRANAVILIVIGLLLLVGTVAAVLPDTMNMDMEPGKLWIVANNVDQNTFTVTVTNTTPGFGPVKGVTVSFAINNSLGTLSSNSGTTNEFGKASTIFKVKTTSGSTNITASVIYSDGTGTYSNTKTLTQYIDHEVPVNINLQYPIEAEVASEVPFNISVIDRWGNPIDGRNTNEIHPISLRIDGPANDCGFKDGTLYQTLSRNLDINGNYSIQIKLSTKSGDHNIQVSPPFKLAKIVGKSTGVPYSMTGRIYHGIYDGVDDHSLPDDTLRANGVDQFIIDYFLYDVYGNPVQNRSLLVNSNLSTELTPVLKSTNSRGQIQMTYGPKVSVLTAKISANSTDNLSVSNAMIANFINAGGKQMVLAVTPQTMASLDAKPTEKAFVRATVVDILGNPVPGETVTFSISGISNSTFNLTVQPYLSNATATTDNDGNAIVLFYPGAFATETEIGFDNAATGTCSISADWHSSTSTDSSIKTIDGISWKNFPYLSIETNVTPQTLHLNDTVDIYINVNGNGFNMGGNPVTAILNEDCTSNMFSNKDPPYESRADSAKAAAKCFVAEMTEGKDHIGLISFGTDTNDEFHLAPQTSKDLVNTKIDSLVKGTNANEFGVSMMEAISNITETQKYRPQDVVRAIVVLKDSGSNIDNNKFPNKDDVIAAATSNSLNPKILIYTVYYYDGTSENTLTQGVLEDLASGTGGKFFKPKTPEELAEAYTKIAKELQRYAGVNVTMNLAFDNVEVNGTEYAGSEVFDYVPVNNGMTSPDSRTTMYWSANTTRMFEDQSPEWNATHQLSFKIGTINLSQYWETTYTLRVKKEGLINLFNSTKSKVVFNDGVKNQTLYLPDTFITVTKNITPLGLQSGTLDVSNLVISGTIKDSIPLQWNLKYTGNSTATETIFYSYNNEPWIIFETRTNIQKTDLPGSPGIVTHNAQLNTQGFKEGSYRIKVHAFAPDAPDDEMIIGIPDFEKGTARLLLK